MQTTIIKADSKKINASVRLPASKSLSNRLLVIKHLCGEDFNIINLYDSSDTVLLGQLLQKNTCCGIIDMHDAGTPMRFLTAVYAITPGRRIIIGSGRLCRRPIGPLVETLKSLGAQIQYLGERGYLPISIDGSGIRGGKVCIDSEISSQFVSALLLIAPVLPDGLEISLKGIVVSAPYINMTLGIMQQYGINVQRSDDRIIIAPQRYQPKDYVVENDWSAAAFWYEIAALAEDAEIMLYGLKQHSLQGDAAVIDIFGKLGVSTAFVNDSVILKKNQVKSNSLELDFTGTPDLFPAITATCAALNISCRFTGIRNLVLKESDRIMAMVTELSRFGFPVKKINDDTLIIESGRTVVKPAEISCHTYNDHRIAMSLAPLSLTDFDVVLDDTSCVAKSYPAYLNNLKNAGFHIGIAEK